MLQRGFFLKIVKMWVRPLVHDAIHIIFPWPVSRECLSQEPGRIEYYNQLFCLCGHLVGVSEIQTSLDVSDL